jgi:ABC-type multidrug transport system ATPase subunit
MSNATTSPASSPVGSRFEIAGPTCSVSPDRSGFPGPTVQEDDHHPACVGRRAARRRITVLSRSMPAQAPDSVGIDRSEQPHLDPTLTVRETLRFQAAFYPTWDKAWAEQLLDTFELDPGRPFGRLSKGQKGKVMMLHALAQRPELLVLDEPTDGLDPVVRRDMLAALLDYVSQHGATVFMSSHLVHELERMCDWIGVMDNGRLVAELPMERFRNGIKRLFIAHAPPDLLGAPFSLLAREANGSASEAWLVRGWEPTMEAYFATVGASLKRVVDLDLEDGFVELLRTFRTPGRSVVRF